MTLRAWLAALAAVASTVLAGCSDPAPPAAPVAEAPVPLSLIKTGAPAGPDLNATTAAPPRLVEGEWWLIRFGSAFYAADGVDVYRVVANASADGYVFGMPHEGWLKEAISYHAPAFGDVAPDLSYATHNERFEPLRFPLTVGETWETSFATAPLVATVESADDSTAEIVFRSPPADPSPADPVTDLLGLTGGDGVAMRLTYDARVHEVVRMESFLGTWEVTGHGYGFEGWVSVPRGEHTAIDYGVFVADQSNPAPGRTVEVGPGFNRMTVLQFVSSLTPGLFRMTSTAPDGQSFVTELSGAPGSKTTFFEVKDPAGTWRQEDLLVGAGGTYTMGIAYEQYDILVPSGAQRASHSHEVVR
jgi:hypothetical protein